MRKILSFYNFISSLEIAIYLLTNYFKCLMIPRAWRKLRNKRPLVINLVSSFHVGQSTRCTCHLLSSSRARVFFMYKRKSEGRCAAKQQNNAKKERSMRSLEHTGTSSSCRLELPRAARLSLSLSLSLSLDSYYPERLRADA